MSRFNSLLVVAIVFLAALQISVALAAEPPAELDIRDSDGKVLIAADQIRSYDWATHTLTLAPGRRAELATVLGETKRLVSGVPFTVSVGGNAVYDGKFTTSASSFSFDQPTIIVDPVTQGITADNDQLRIQLGYPTQEFFKGADPRADKRIEDALKVAGKLTDTRKDRIEWVAASLLEMQTIKQGSTREELLKIFVEEGGLSGRFQRRYAYRDCPYFKVDVKFNAADSTNEKIKEDPQDKVSQISTPFLEWPIAD